MNEGVINQWLVEEGAYVEKGQELATVETEKVAYDVESPEAGYLHIVVAEGETVPCETLIARFAETEAELATLQSAGDTPAAVTANEAEQAAPVAASPAPKVKDSSARVIASPLARHLARDANLDLHGVTGTGPGGRIVKRDVLPLLAAPQTSDAVLARVPFTGMRKTIADRMTASLQSTAQLSGNWESDITAMMAFRQEYVRREAELGTRVSVNALIARAMAYAIKQVPVANSCLENDEIVIDTRTPAQEDINVDDADFEVTLRDGGVVTVELQKGDSEPYRFRPKTNTIKADSNAISVSQSNDVTRYISSIDNMRASIKTIGDEERNYLPLWMRTAQTGFEELDYITAIPVCYCKPGESATIINNIKNYGFDPKLINYDIDRYIVKRTENSDVEKFVLFANYQFNV